jgi:L-ascorbate metabolism protein UlaG (beta-lactamase superfamily)
MGSMLNLPIFFFYSFMLMAGPNNNHDGSRFYNPWEGGNDLKSFFAVLKWKLTTESAEWPENVTNKDYPLTSLSPGEKVTATFINHATFLLRFPGLHVLTDPVYSERTSPYRFLGPKRVRAPGIPLESLPPIDVVIISHNHYDHLDIETIQLLEEKHHPLFLVPLGDDRLLKSYGIQNIRAMDWWDEVRVKDVRFIFAPAQHWSARSLWDKNESLWGSYMIDSGAIKVYHAGDTGLGPHFKDIKSRLGAPDLALLPIGAYKPRWFMKTYHLDPEEAIRAHQLLGATRSIGMHFGTFQLTDEGFDEPVNDLLLHRQKAGLKESDFFVIDQGQTVSY